MAISHLAGLGDLQSGFGNKEGATDTKRGLSLGSASCTPRNRTPRYQFRIGTSSDTVCWLCSVFIWLVPTVGTHESTSSEPRPSSVQSLSRVRFFAAPCTAAHQASLSITSSRSLLKFMSIESVMPSNHLILCRPRLLLPSISPRIRVFSNQSALRIRGPKYWSFSFSISPPISGLISFRIDWFDSLLSKGLSRVFSNITVQKHRFLGAQLSSQPNFHILT